MKYCPCPNCGIVNQVPEVYVDTQVKCIGCIAEFRAEVTQVAPSLEEVRSQGAWPMIREGVITASHAIFDWGNKVRLETHRKRAESRVRRLEGDRERVEVKAMRALGRTPVEILFGAEDDEKSESKGWRGQGPTRKQIALLQHLGVMEEPDSRGQASDWIDQRFKDSQYDGHLRRKADDWEIARLIKHPDIFREELHSFYLYKLYDELHDGVRRSVVNASGRLTRTKIAAVVNTLTDEDPWWIKDPARFGIFFERLKTVHPECCDGRAPDRNSNAAPKGQPVGCTGVIVIGTVIGGGIARAFLA